MTKVNAVTKIANAIDRILELNHQIDVLDQENTKLSKEVKDFMGANEELTHGGYQIATYKQDKDSTTIDTKALQQDHPDLVATYTKVKTGARRFLVPNALGRKLV